MRLAAEWSTLLLHFRPGRPRLAVIQKRTSTRGFSLLETLIVVAVASVLMGTAVINLMSTLPQSRANAAANQILREIRRARFLAISERRTTQVLFSGGNQITLLQVPPGGGPPVSLPSDPPTPLEGGAHFIYMGTGDTPMSFGTCASGACFSSSAGTATPVTQFLADGTFSEAVNVPVNGTIFLGIPGNPTTARAITILGATARIRLYKWDGKNWQE
jgi:prepilin-type N-terminal cleavage/methylation domain-containing protein